MQISPEKTYHLFLTHHPSNSQEVEDIARRLEAAGLSVFLHRWHLLPGDPLQETIEAALGQSAACAVFVGSQGLTLWDNEEMRVALEKRIQDRSFRVIPVLLPGADPTDSSVLPPFLRRLTWVDFRSGLDNTQEFERFVAGINAVTRRDRRMAEVPTNSSYKPGSPATTTKILFLGANPSTTIRLKLDEEVKNIQTNLKLAKERERLDFKQEWAVTVDALLQALLDESPSIVHFSGHGEQAGLILQNEAGEPKLVTADALSNLFKLFKDTVHCVLLNCCYSEAQAHAIKLYIPHVIGMQTAIPDKAAIAFTTGFYKALGAGRNIPFAFELGVAAVKLEGVTGNIIPILL